MINYQVGPTYKSTRDDICPISFGIEPLKLFHMKSLKERFQSVKIQKFTLGKASHLFNLQYFELS